MTAPCAAVALLLALGLTAELGLHFLAPRFAVTWGYAHLDRHPGLPWVAAGLVVLLPLATAVAWRRPGAGKPIGTLPWWSVAVAAAATWLVLATAGVSFPAPLIAFDQRFFLGNVMGFDPPMPRWHLAIHAFRALAALL